MLTKKEKSERSGKKVMAMINRGGIVTDREWPIYLFGLTKDKSEDWFIRKIFGHEINAITLDILNAITHKLSEWWRKEFDETGKMPELILVEDFDSILTDGAVQVYISESEIKKFLKKPNYSKEFIYKHIKKIGTLSIEGIAPTRWDRKKGGWKNKPITGGFAEVICINDPEVREEYQGRLIPPRKKGRWKGVEEYVYVVRFIGTWGKEFAGSVLNRRIKIMPERFYRYLSLTAKMLCRVIVGTKYSPITLSLNQILKILGWKDELTNLALKRKLITRAFESLVKYYFIESFKFEPEAGEEEYWTIWKRKNWFYEPKPIKASDI